MPKPMPMMDENHDDFMDRCMADKNMMADHPDKPDRQKKCQAMWDENMPMAKASALPEIERRFCPVSIGICERTGEKPIIAGYAAVFHRPGDARTEFKMGDWFTERIDRGAFDRALRDRQDVRALVNHDAGGLLGRTSAGTLRLSVDQTGLRYEIDLGETTAARDTLASIRRGDMTGSSFAFMVKEQRWTESQAGPDLREILDVDLIDVGPVTYPAYEATSAETNSAREKSVAEYLVWKQERLADVEWEMRARQRLLEIST